MNSKRTVATALVAFIAGFFGASFSMRLWPVPSVMAQGQVVSTRDLQVVDSNGRLRARLSVSGDAEERVSLALFSGPGGNQVQRVLLMADDSGPWGRLLLGNASTSGSSNIDITVPERLQPSIALWNAATRNTITFPGASGTGGVPPGLALLQQQPPLPVVSDPFARPIDSDEVRYPSSTKVDLDTLRDGVVRLHNRVVEIERRINMMR